jgi:Lon protease-like protein
MFDELSPEEVQGFFYLYQNSQNMKTLNKAIPIAPIKRFIFPKGTYSIVINSSIYFEQLHEALLFGKEIGIPFWFGEDFNVYGCTARVLSVYQNERKGFIRVKVEGVQLFRITKYSKKNQKDCLSEADVKFLDFSEETIQDKSIIEYFTQITGTEIYDFNAEIKLLELLNWLNLKHELTVAIISKEHQFEREQLLKRILKYIAITKSQKKVGHLN